MNKWKWGMRMEKGLLVGSLVAVCLIASGCNGQHILSSNTTKAKQVQSSDAGIKTGTVDVQDIKIKILDAHYIKEDTYDGQQQPQLAVNYEVTNHSNKDISADTAWSQIFQGEQVVDKSIRQLDVASLPALSQFDSVRKNMSKKVGVGQTMKAAVTYNIVDVDSPVILQATDEGKSIGSKTIMLH